MITASLLLALLPAQAHAARVLQEGATASYTIIYVDTNTPRVNIGTNTTPNFSTPNISNVALFVASNVVVASNPNAPGCVIYATGTLACTSLLGAVAAGSIDTPKLSADAVITSKILTGAVTSAKTTGQSQTCTGTQYNAAAVYTNGLLTSGGSCTAMGAGVGVGDAVLAATQTFTGANTFTGQTAFTLTVTTPGYSSGWSNIKGANSQNGSWCLGSSQANMDCWEHDGQTTGDAYHVNQTNDNNADRIFRMKGNAGPTGWIDAFKITGFGVHLSSTPTPTFACNVGTIIATAGSSAHAGKFTAGTAAANCTVTFATAYPRAPACWCNDETNILVIQAISTVNDVKCTAAVTMSNDVISYGCEGAP